MTDKKEKDKKCLKIIFQVTNFNIFQSTSIGYLFEISQNHEVVLMTEKLNSNIEKIIKDKKLFPGIKKIIFFNSPFRKNILLKNFNLYNKTKKIIKNYKPDIVIAPSDIWPAEMYLMRLAKRIGAITVAIQGGFKIAEQKKLYLWSCLKNSYSKSYRILPSFIRIFFVKIKKYLGYYLYHWILPLLNIEKPFIGRPSFIFWDESSGLRDADYSIVFSKRDYDLSLLDGVSRDKLLVINHPLDCKTTISL